MKKIYLFLIIIYIPCVYAQDQIQGQTQEQVPTQVPVQGQTQEQVPTQVPVQGQTQEQVPPQVPVQGQTQEQVPPQVPAQGQTQEQVPPQVPVQGQTQEQVPGQVPTPDVSADPTFLSVEEIEKRKEKECENQRNGFLKKFKLIKSELEKDENKKLSDDEILEKFADKGITEEELNYYREWDIFKTSIEEKKKTSQNTDVYPFDESLFQNEDQKWINLFSYVFVIVRKDPSKKRPYHELFAYKNGVLVFKTKVSLARETIELKRTDPKCQNAPEDFYYSYTPDGYYTFNKLFPEKRNLLWGVDLAHVMFFQLKKGLALHAFNIKSTKDLVKQSSGGCIRLDPSTAKLLFDSTLATAGAKIPSVSQQGKPEFDKFGNLKMKIWKGSPKNLISDFKTYGVLLAIQSVPIVNFLHGKSDNVKKQILKRVTYNFPSSFISTEEKANCPDVFECVKNDVLKIEAPLTTTPVVPKVPLETSPTTKPDL